MLLRRACSGKPAPSDRMYFETQSKCTTAHAHTQHLSIDSSCRSGCMVSPQRPQGPRAAASIAAASSAAAGPAAGGGGACAAAAGAALSPRACVPRGWRGREGGGKVSGGGRDARRAAGAAARRRQCRRGRRAPSAAALCVRAGRCAPSAPLWSGRRGRAMREAEAEELVRVSARAPSRALSSCVRVPPSARARSLAAIGRRPRARARAMLLWAAARRDAGG